MAVETAPSSSIFVSTPIVTNTVPIVSAEEVSHGANIVEAPDLIFTERDVGQEHVSPTSKWIMTCPPNLIRANDHRRFCS